MYELSASEGIQDGESIWNMKRKLPTTNPDGYGLYTGLYDEYIGTKSFESLRGISVSNDNYVQMTPGKIASDISYPDEENLDEFISADCKAVGNGGKFYEIVNRDDLTSGFVKIEIEAGAGANAYENYDMEDEMAIKMLEKLTKS